MADPKLIKICLTNKGEDTETPWAHELGPAPNAPAGSVRVKLVNVPFMHAKPTWGDTIVVTPKPGDYPTWDRDGVPWKQIQTRIVEDGGRWAMIIDYLPRGANNDQSFAALGRACETAKIICEGAWGPRETDPGRAYLAVQKELNAEHVMGILEGAALPLQLIQVHPEPKKKAPPPRAQTVVGISDAAGRPPAKQPRAKTEPPVESPVSKRAATKPPTAANASSALKKGAKAATKAAAKEVVAAEKAASKEAAAAAKAAAAKKAAAEKAAVEKAAAKAAQVAVKAALAKKAKPAAKKPAPPAKKPAKKK